MRTRSLTLLFAALLIAGATPAIAQNPPRGQQQPPPPAKAGPYKIVAVTPPQATNDLAFEAFRKQMGEAAQHKDRAGLAKLVVGQGFFWLRENGDRADKRKSGVDNLAAALGLNNKDGAGWDMLASFADRSDRLALARAQERGLRARRSDLRWQGIQRSDANHKDRRGRVGLSGLSANVEVRAAPQASAPVVDKLALAFVRVMPEGGPNVPTFLRVVTPSGKTGYVSVDSVAPVGNDQICYVNDVSGWKIGGYIGGGDSQ